MWARLLIVFGAVLAIGSGGTIAGFHIVLAEATKSFGKQDLLGKAAGATTGGKHASITGAKNILLIGVDSRPGQNADLLIRSDTIIIMHIPADHTEGYLVSIPRDTKVHIPAYDNGKHKYPGGNEKINAAFAHGGEQLTGDTARQHSVELLALTLKDLYGLTFDAAAIVDFTGFQKVVGVLGGVDMCVDEDTKSIHIGYKNGKQVSPSVRLHSDGTVAGPLPGVTPKDYPVGCYHMKDWEALDFVRQRDLLKNQDTDYGRQRHQQQFLKAIFKEIASKDVLTNPGKLSGVLNTIGQAMTIDQGKFSIQDWLFAMKGIGADDLITLKTNDGHFNPVPGDLSYEALNATSLQMLQSVKDDTMAEFVNLHPDWVASST
ncbi:LCP family protein [Rugosimonospora acidiphila]|uniref:LCP family protein n=1 Tax=Rugosimonospora acidiphila TaxID=556531 RepID=UPI0031EF5452